MKFTATVALLAAAPCASFHMAHRPRTVQSCRSTTELDMSSRHLAGIAAALSALTLTLAPVQAANYGGVGSTYSEVVDPKTAVLNDELAGSEAVKEGQAKLLSYKKAVDAIKQDLLKNSQLDVESSVASQLKVGEIRVALNKFNTAFSEDTQRGTDRLIRNIIQNVGELEKEAKQKAGKPRADTKVAVIVRRLEATANSLDELSKFLPAK